MNRELSEVFAQKKSSAENLGRLWITLLDETAVGLTTVMGNEYFHLNLWNESLQSVETN
jgi:hypothetical protein